MAPLPPVANVLRVRLFFTLNGKETQGVRYFQRFSGSSPTSTVCVTLANIIHATFVGNGLLAVLSVGNQFTGVEVTDLSSTMGGQGRFSSTTSGTRTGLPIPVDTAFLTSYEITRRYRGGHDRSYWPFGVDTDLTTPNKWKTASVTAFHTAVQLGINATTGRATHGTVLGRHVGVSYYKGFTVVTSPTTGRARNVPTKRVTPLVTNVTSIVGRQEVASFRRRRLVSP